MLDGEPYDPLDPRLVAERERARGLIPPFQPDGGDRRRGRRCRFRPFPRARGDRRSRWFRCATTW
ncbi:maltose acetyltransferase domain-containing protein [Halomarina halobia]|uniref:Maltose acetyltransferase domain-containing protein n=2 Tax=Halomarina halobia TaxID=3033386 RepID=A0ABD6AAS8_9EURY